MVKDSFRDGDGIRGIGEKAAGDLLEHRELSCELRCGPCVSVEPSFNKLNLVCEMQRGCTESRGVESSLLQPNGAKAYNQ